MNTINDLFRQLGLDSSDEGINAFIAGHRLNDNEVLSDATFWNSAQSEFIRKSWLDDSDWVGAIESLNNRLHK